MEGDEEIHIFYQGYEHINFPEEQFPHIPAIHQAKFREVQDTSSSGLLVLHLIIYDAVPSIHINHKCHDSQSNPHCGLISCLIPTPLSSDAMAGFR